MNKAKVQIRTERAKTAVTKAEGGDSHAHDRRSHGAGTERAGPPARQPAASRLGQEPEAREARVCGGRQEGVPARVCGLQAASAQLGAQLSATASTTYDGTPSASGLIWPVGWPRDQWLRLALGPDARGHRHRRRYGDACCRFRQRHRHPRRLDGRLREPGCSSTTAAASPRPTRTFSSIAAGGSVCPGAGHRLRGLHGPLLRGALHFEVRINGGAGRSARLSVAKRPWRCAGPAGAGSGRRPGRSRSRRRTRPER